MSDEEYVDIDQVCAFYPYENTYMCICLVSVFCRCSSTIANTGYRV